MSLPRNASEQDEVLLVVPTEDQEEALQAPQAVVKVMCQDVQDELSLYQDWRDSGAAQELPESQKDILQEKVELNNRLKQ